MRIDLDTEFWVVVDPTPRSTLPDIVFQSCLRDLENQFNFGLCTAENLNLYDDEDAAERDGLARLAGQRAGRAVAEASCKESWVYRICGYDEDGEVVFEINVT